MMEERAPSCGVRVEPHIRSRHKFLKKDFHVVHLLRNQSGCGWDEVTKTPPLDDDVFENIVKVFPNCKKFNRKPFPFYDELLKVFGKVGPANGRKTVGLTNDVSSPAIDGPTFIDLDVTQTPQVIEGHSAERFMEDLINEGVEMSQRAAATTSTHKAVPLETGACDDIRKRAKKTEN
ncbi:unnamed protein product [Linum trigynum]|uniref:Myb/SANT-like domain-containing protein n=1 Tax=Linum trigynum TaxID=586398 RepID=A0AAV2GCC4_9ROSI